MTAKKKAKPPAVVKPDPRVLQLVQAPDETRAEMMGRIAADPAVNAGSVMQSFSSHLGDEVDLMSMIGAIQGATKRVKAGDLSDLEGMLVSQAAALQTIFTSLARRAQAQQYQRNLESFLNLALKAQAQSRSTISALVDLKYPRTTVIAKQANVANGPQQVNNGNFETNPPAYAHAAENRIPEIKELEASDGQWLDTRAPGTAIPTHPNLEAVGEGNRADKPRRKGQGVT
ncbi:hypothetical protein ABIC89_002806 [Variovorax boronicumulans]|uniref:hypothetical protein n=1 Tax=Variovorax boronicumulans TaxID=436515 RepID=UPI00339B418E